MLDKYIPCPVCKSQIPVDVYQLIRGMQFLCPNCQVAIGLSTQSQPLVEDALNKLDNLKKGGSVQGKNM